MKPLLVTEKIISVEWLRGLASLGICEMHIFCAQDFFSTTDTFFHTYLFPLSIIGRLGVAVFFVISGFIIPYSMWRRNYTHSKYLSFLTKRLIRLEPPYIITIALSVIIAFITTTIFKNELYEINWLNLAMHLGYLNVFFDNVWVNPVFWTLAIEFQFYILIGILFPLVSSKPNAPLLLILSILSTLISLNNPGHQFIFIHFHLFILGIICFQKFINKIHPVSFWLQIFINSGSIYYFHGKGYVVAALLTMLIILYNVNIKSNYMLFLGKISYSLYLIHWIVGVELIRNIFMYYFPDSSQSTKILLGLFILAVCLGLSALFFKFVEEPSIQWAKIPYRKFTNATQTPEKVLEI